MGAIKLPWSWVSASMVTSTGKHNPLDQRLGMQKRVNKNRQQRPWVVLNVERCTPKNPQRPDETSTGAIRIRRSDPRSSAVPAVAPNKYQILTGACSEVGRVKSDQRNHPRRPSPNLCRDANPGWGSTSDHTDGNTDMLV